jgi:hypothetical protein
MAPLTDLDRALQEALRVEPSGDFAARIRTRVAQSPRHSRVLAPRFALAAIAGAVLAVAVTSVWRAPDTVVRPSVVPHRDLMVLAQPSRVLPSPPQRAPRRSPASFEQDHVMVSRSEMLALQRLFAGITVAPPALPPPAVELSIPELAIAPLVTGGPEGERQ